MRRRLTGLGRRIAPALLLLAVAASGLPVRADEPAKPAPAKASEALPADATTSHVLDLGGRKLDYAATAGTLVLRNDKQEPQATIFYAAYTLTGPDAGKRPVTIAFNGGPGAASAYLQLGAMGPRVIDFGDAPATAPRSNELVDNRATWLDFTDLVFIDPVGTGYSHAAPGVDAAKEFWSVDRDLRTLAEAIRLYLTRSGRTTSPVYLAGESYGGFRAARLAHSLIAEYGVRVAGATMISPVLDFALVRGGDLDPLPVALRLPSYAAVALEQRQALTPEALREVEQFALGDYLLALAGGRHDAQRTSAVDAAVARFSGLPEELVRRLEGRIPPNVFIKEFRHDESRVLSRYDGAVSVADPYPAAPMARGDDPILDGTRPIFTGAMVAYLRDELGFRTELPYELLSRQVSRHWDWSIHSPWAGLGAADDLREALSLNPQFRAAIAHGMTDLETPYMTSRYVVDHLPQMGPAPRLTLKLYPGGHMMYLRAGTRQRLHDDAAELYRDAAG